MSHHVFDDETRAEFARHLANMEVGYVESTPFTRANPLMFNLDTDQRAKLEAWVAALPPAKTGCIGGRLTYHFTPTSIGDVVKVSDCITKTEIDLSDYESW